MKRNQGQWLRWALLAAIVAAVIAPEFVDDAMRLPTFFGLMTFVALGVVFTGLIGRSSLATGNGSMQAATMGATGRQVTLCLLLLFITALAALDLGIPPGTEYAALGVLLLIYGLSWRDAWLAWRCRREARRLGKVPCRNCDYALEPSQSCCPECGHKQPCG